MRRLPAASSLRNGALGLGLTFALAFGVACSGGGSDEPPITEAEAATATNNYLKTTLGLFTGVTQPQAFIDQYAPECREGADPANVAMVAALMQGLAPTIQGANIEAVDVGPLTVTEGRGGVLVTPLEPSAMRLQIDGQFVPAAEFFSGAGFVPTEGEFGDPVLLLRRDGVVYLGDCNELKDIAVGLGGS